MNSGNNCGLQEKEDEGTSSKRTNRAGSGSSQNVKKEIPSNQGDVEMVREAMFRIITRVFEYYVIHSK